MIKTFIYSGDDSGTFEAGFPCDLWRRLHIFLQLLYFLVQLQVKTGSLNRWESSPTFCSAGPVAGPTVACRAKSGPDPQLWTTGPCRPLTLLIDSLKSLLSAHYFTTCSKITVECRCKRSAWQFLRSLIFLFLYRHYAAEAFNLQRTGSRPPGVISFLCTKKAIICI